jgi:hypothetical protein
MKKSSTSLVIKIILSAFLLFIFSIPAYSEEKIGKDAKQFLKDQGFTFKNGELYDKTGSKVKNKRNGSGEAQQTDGASPFSEQVEDDDMYSLDSSDLLEALATESCSWYWIHGWHKWKYNYYLFYTHASFKASTKTTWGTSTASCGTALIADRLYFDARVGPSDWNWTGWDKTAYNTDYLYDKNTVDAFNIGNPCGMVVYHEAQVGSVVWSTTTKSGCSVDSPY